MTSQVNLPWTCMFSNLYSKIFHDSRKVTCLFFVSAGQILKDFFPQHENSMNVCIKLRKIDCIGCNFIFVGFWENHGNFSMHVSQNTRNQIFVIVIIYCFHRFFFVNRERFNKEHMSVIVKNRKFKESVSNFCFIKNKFQELNIAMKCWRLKKYSSTENLSICHYYKLSSNEGWKFVIFMFEYLLGSQKISYFYFA